MGRKAKPEKSVVRGARSQLLRRLKGVVVERDALRALRNDLDDLIGSCEDAIEGLESAIEALSRYC